MSTRTTRSPSFRHPFYHLMAFFLAANVIPQNVSFLQNAACPHTRPDATQILEPKLILTSSQPPYLNLARSNGAPPCDGSNPSTSNLQLIKGMFGAPSTPPRVRTTFPPLTICSIGLSSLLPHIQMNGTFHLLTHQLPFYGRHSCFSTPLSSIRLNRENQQASTQRLLSD